jgi:hypothetical protein
MELTGTLKSGGTLGILFYGLTMAGWSIFMISSQSAVCLAVPFICIKHSQGNRFEIQLQAKCSCCEIDWKIHLR